MEKLLENISKQLEELIRLNKNKNDEIDKLKKEIKELKENMNKVKSYEILSEIEVPIDNRIEKVNKNIEILKHLEELEYTKVETRPIIKISKDIQIDCVLGIIDDAINSISFELIGVVNMSLGTFRFYKNYNEIKLGDKPQYLIPRIYFYEIQKNKNDKDKLIKLLNIKDLEISLEQ